MIISIEMFIIFFIKFRFVYLRCFESAETQQGRKSNYLIDISQTLQLTWHLFRMQLTCV